MAKKHFGTEWILEPLLDNPSFYTKGMFGGLAVYYEGLMVLTLTNSNGDREWKGKKYDFDLWDGVLVCTSKEHHEFLTTKFKSLISHPVLPKWLYLPMEDPKFESTAQGLVELIAQRDPHIGIVPGTRKKKAKKKKAAPAKKKKKTVSKGKTAKKKPRKKSARR